MCVGIVTEQNYRVKIIVFFVIGVIVGVGFSQLYVNVIQPSLAPALSVEQMYEQAVDDAVIAKSSEIYSELTPIVETNLNLSWRGEASRATRAFWLLCGQSTIPVIRWVKT